MTGYTAAQSKMAFGLQHKAATSKGISDAKDGQWLVGKETPEAADYTIVPTMTGNNFEVKVEIGTYAFEAGGYAIYLGTSDSYARVQLSQSAWEAGSKIQVGNVRILMRTDESPIVAEAMPGLIVTESTIVTATVEDVVKPFLKIGGAFGTMDATTFQAANIAIKLERQLPASATWISKEFKDTAVEKVVEGTKGYLKIDLSAVDVGGYQIKISYDGGANYPNTEMECESFDNRANPTAVGNQALATYFDAEHNDKDHLYACAGLFVSHAHTYSRPEAKVGTSDLYKLNCISSCSTVAYELDAVDCDGANNPNISVSNSRLGPSYGGASDTWDITGIEAGEYEVQLEAAVKSDSYWNAWYAINEKHETASNNGNVTKDTMRYTFQAGTDAKAEPTAEIGTKKYTETGLKQNAKGLSDVLCKIMIKPGGTTFKVISENVGYAMWVFGVRLTKVGSYVAAPINVAFTQGEMKIEAEDYSLKHTIYTESGEETEHTRDGSRYPESLDGSLVEDATASGGQYIHGVFREGWNQSKRSNYSGEIQYNVKLAAAATVKIKAKIKSNMTTSKVCFDLKVDGTQKETFNAANEWIEVESAAMELAAGIHTISFVGQQLGESESYESVLADLDYFVLVEQAPATPAA